MPEDIFDIVDTNDNVIGKAPRSYVHTNKLLHRTAQILIFCNSATGRKILLQLRSRFKDSHPLKYTASCSGHVDTGETYDEGAVRELREETGLEVSPTDLTKIGKLEASEETGYEFAYVYEYECLESEKFTFDKSEVELFEWATISEFETMLKERPEKITSVFKAVYEFYLSKTKK